MQRIDPIAGKPVEQPVLDHRARAALAFLGGLEHEIDRARKIPGFRQCLRRTQQHRDMAIMPATMKAARRRTRPGQTGLFIEGQRIHIGAQPHASRAVPLMCTGAQHADHARAADPLGHIQPGIAQHLRDPRGGAEFGKAQFGMRMDIAPQRGQRADEFGQVMHGSRFQPGDAYSKSPRRRAVHAIRPRPPKRHHVAPGIAIPRPSDGIMAEPIRRDYCGSCASCSATNRASNVAGNSCPITDSRLARLRASGCTGTRSPNPVVVIVLRLK